MQETLIVVKEGLSLNAAIVHYLTDLKSVMMLNQPLVSNDEDRVTSWAPEIVRRVTPGGGLGNTISRILLDAAAKSEAVGAGSGEATLHLTTFLTLKMLQQIGSGEHPQKLLQRLQEDAESILEFIQVETRWPILEELHGLLGMIASCDFERDLVLTAIDLAGLEGRIFVEITSVPKSSIEQTQDHSFQLSPVPEVVDPLDSWSASNVRVGIIDGMIEKVSEIHAILEAASINAEPVVLFCRGFSEEVIATLGLNRKRGTLNVIPVTVPFDIDSANTLKDLAVILNSDVVTALKGQLISSMTWDDMVVADEVRWSSGILTICSDMGIDSIAIHTSSLMKRRSELPPDGRRDILDSRIRSLTTFGVCIKVGGLEANHHVQMIDMLLRTVRSVVSYGLIDTNVIQNYLDNNESILAHMLITIMKNSNFLGLKPAISTAAVIKYSMEATTSIINTGVAILLDR